MPRRLTYWACQLLGWGLYALIAIGLSLLYGGATRATVGQAVAVAALGAVATHGLRAVVRWRGWLALEPARLVPRLLAASVATAAAMGVAWIVGGAAVGSEELRARSLAVLLFNWTPLVLAWVALYAGAEVVRRGQAAERARAAAEAESWRLRSAVTEAELRALRAQVHPHFLFNALNTVRALIAERPARAQDAVTELADLLRYALAAGRQPTVPLREELAAVEAYLALEALRFEERLAVSVDVAPEALGAPVPPLVVQALVENGIKHGIGGRPEGGALAVRAATEGEVVRVVVESPGTFAPSAHGEGGLGLANASERLRRLCGEAASLTVRQHDAATVRAEIVVPAAEAVDPPPVADEVSA